MNCKHTSAPPTFSRASLRGLYHPHCSVSSRAYYSRSIKSAQIQPFVQLAPLNPPRINTSRTFSIFRISLISNDFNSTRINTSGNKDLKSFRINTSKKRRRGREATPQLTVRRVRQLSSRSVIRAVGEYTEPVGHGAVRGSRDSSRSATFHSRWSVGAETEKTSDAR
jgi:hypothetical protein